MAERTFAETADHAAEVLPEGWEIRVCYQQNSGWVELKYEGEAVDFPSNAGTVEREFDDALKFACEAKMFSCPQCGYDSPWIDGTDTEVRCQTCGHEFPATKEPAP